MRSAKSWISLLGRTGAIAAGNFLYALAVAAFLVPNQLITGGTTGLALFFYRTAGIPVSLFVGVFNLAMFLVGAWILGKSFAVTTAMSTVLYPLMLHILERTGVGGMVMEERLMAVIYAGLLIGGGLGLVMRAGASTGGMDIPALICKKKWNWSVSVVLYASDCLILGLQLVATELTAILYGLLLIMIYTVTLDKVLLTGASKVQVKIISKKYEKINQLLGEQLDCGTSLIHMETGFLHQSQDMVMTVISNRDLPRVNQLVLSLDPEAFMIVSQIYEVRGRGFTMSKVYQNQAVRGEIR